MTEPVEAAAGVRPGYPWYDSGWMERYLEAQDIVREVRPDALADFVAALSVFRTRADFDTAVLEPFDDAAWATIRHTVATIRPTDLEMHEAHNMGRLLVHDLPALEEIHRSAVDLVSERVGEAVEPAFRFMAFYTDKGVLPMHIDAPDSKWTLDVCLEQSGPWPIHISQVVPWPEPRLRWEPGWEEEIRRSPAHRFAEHRLEPGQAALFSGSGQWHYRDVIPRTTALPYCKMLFLQYVPKGSSDLLRPKHWARIFGIPELSRLNPET